MFVLFWFNSRPDCFSVHLGLTNRNDPEPRSIMRSVETVIIHEEYNSDTNKNDIALLKLVVSLIFNAF